MFSLAFSSLPWPTEYVRAIRRLECVQWLAELSSSATLELSIKRYGAYIFAIILHSFRVVLKRLMCEIRSLCILL